MAEIIAAEVSCLTEQMEITGWLAERHKRNYATGSAIATREGEFNALQNSNRLLHQKIETVVFEIQSLAARRTGRLAKTHARCNHG